MHERFTGSELDCRVHGQSSAFSANGLFTAHITGNVVVLAAHIVARDPAILSYILSVPVFMLILFLTRLLAGGLERTGFRRRGRCCCCSCSFLLPSSPFASWRARGETPTQYSRSPRVCSVSRQWRCRTRSCRFR